MQEVIKLVGDAIGEIKQVNASDAGLALLYKALALLKQQPKAGEFTKRCRKKFELPAEIIPNAGLLDSMAEACNYIDRLEADRERFIEGHAKLLESEKRLRGQTAQLGAKLAAVNGKLIVERACWAGRKRLAEQLAEDYEKLEQQLAAAQAEIERLSEVLKSKCPGEWLIIKPVEQKGG